MPALQTHNTATLRGEGGNKKMTAGGKVGGKERTTAAAGAAAGFLRMPWLTTTIQWLNKQNKNNNEPTNQPTLYTRHVLQTKGTGRGPTSSARSSFHKSYEESRLEAQKPNTLALTDRSKARSRATIGVALFFWRLF